MHFVLLAQRLRPMRNKLIQVENLQQHYIQDTTCLVADCQELIPYNCFCMEVNLKIKV
jgi:hypothetical protein